MRGAHSDWVIATDMLSEHESTFCIGCLTTNEDVGGLDFFSLMSWKYLIFKQKRNL